MRYQHTPEEVRIRKAIGSMPGGGNTCISMHADRIGYDLHTPRPITLDTIGPYLEALVEFYASYMKDAEVRKEELRDRKADIAAVRRVLGVGEEKP